MRFLSAAVAACLVLVTIVLEQTASADPGSILGLISSSSASPSGSPTALPSGTPSGTPSASPTTKPTRKPKPPKKPKPPPPPLPAYALADPDSMQLADGRIATYATTQSSGLVCGETTPRQLWIPWVITTGVKVVPQCIGGDAMPQGPPAWAAANQGLWAPGIIDFKGTYWLFYSAVVAGTTKRCIGVARSSTAQGPFTDRGKPLICPPATYWAIDPAPVAYRNHLYLTYRDDQYNPGGSALVSIQLDANARRAGTGRHLLLTTDKIRWAGAGMGTPIIENPSFIRGAQGTWWLFFSGNNWKTDSYATGVANCGRSPIPKHGCTTVQRGNGRPYFGYRPATNPFRLLPGNHPGPGGLSLFPLKGGSIGAVWHWWPTTGAAASNPSRYAAWGMLQRAPTGFRVID